MSYYNEHFNKEVLNFYIAYLNDRSKISEWLLSSNGYRIDNCWFQAVNLTIMPGLTNLVYGSRFITFDPTD